MREKQQDPRQLHADAATLRRRAQEQAGSLEQASLSTHTPEEIKELIHELRVHQIELEMQNDELRTAQMQLEDGRARYYDLYDLAPVGYCTISEKGIILEANLTLTTMLGVNRQILKNKTFSSFILREDQNIYYRLRQASFDTGKTIPCELRMVRSDKTIFWASLQFAELQDEDGTKSLRVAITDFSKQKMAELELHESERFLRSTLDGLSSQIAVINGDGEIVLTNKAYRDFAVRNNIEHSTVCEGCNYLAVCDTAQGEESEEASVFAKGIREVLSGKLPSFKMEYSCHSSDEQRWFLGRVTPCNGGGLRRAIIAHENITERKLVEEKNIVQNNLLKKLPEQVPGVIYQYRYHADGRNYFPYASSAIWDVYEVTPEEVKEDASKVLSRLHPDDYNDVMEGILHSAKTLENWKAEYRVILPNQGERWVSGVAKPEKLEDGSILWHGYISDITERKIIEEQLNQNVKDLLESQRIAHLGTWRLDLATNHVVWSEELYKMYGFDPSLPVPDYTEHMKLFTPESWDQLSSALDGTRTTGIPYELELETVTLDGSNGWMWVSGEAEKDSEGNIISLWGAAQDISESKRIEAELLKAKEHAERANAAKSQFLSNMSHEIRTPMNGFMGIIQLMQMTELTEEQQDLMRIAKSSSDRLLNLVSDILDYSRIEVGKIQFEKTIFNLGKMINDTMDLFKVSAATSGLLIEVSIGSDVPNNLVGDSFRLKQILSNLIGNAIKFTRQGSINIGVKDIKVQSNEGVQLEFVVKDTGIGIQLDKVDVLFKRFSQVDNSDTRVYGGSGLGLSICKGLVEQMGGEIWVESIEGEGSSFYFTCVFEKVVEQIDFIEPAAVMLTQELRNISILIVEDDAVSRTVMEKFAARKGWNITVAENGKHAIDIFKQSSFDIVLIDVQMPVMNGYETTGVFRELQSSNGTHTPIIAMTAFALKGDREKCLEAGMDDYLSKPVDVNEFYAAVEKWTKNGSVK